jgi:hypothetical protein
LRSTPRTLHEHLKKAKNDFFDTVTGDLHYFGSGAQGSTELALPDKTTFEKTICRRLAVAGLLVEKLHADPNFGRTKLAKLFYLANTRLARR